jgi:mono/diheme cytochrome c family protein
VENLSNEIRMGGNGAPAFSELLSEQQHADVIAYVLTL